jgi:hypothetical protein
MPGVWYLAGYRSLCLCGIFHWKSAAPNEQYRSYCFWLGAEGDKS